MESTTPVAAPAKATKGRDFEPISSSCRSNSRNSKGGVTAARKTCQQNMPKSPNHSKNWLINPLVEATLEDMVGFELPYRGICLRFASISRSVTELIRHGAARILLKMHARKQRMGTVVAEFLGGIPMCPSLV